MNMRMAALVLASLTANLIVACGSDNPSSTSANISVAKQVANQAESAQKPPQTYAGGEQLVGQWSHNTLSQAQFFGVPYAAPPVGEGRFRPPGDHTPRDGVQQSSAFGPACVQEQGNPNWYRIVAAGLGAQNADIPDLENMSEDCLTLNVWTENLNGKEKWPVLVWIYGGSNKNGFSHEPNYQGHKVASKGVVFVSINYRVGALGFMSHPELSKESPQGSSGNYGLLDQIKALQWVRDNIAAFGGDPEAVTIAGESAGAGNSANLIASPLAKNLFRAAILQSGGMSMGARPNLSDNEQHGVALAKALGVDTAKDVLSQLREIPALTIMETQGKSQSAYNSVVEDGWVLPKSARTILENGEHNAVNLLTGSNAQEWIMYFDPDSGEREYREALKFYGGSKADQLGAIFDATGLSALEKRDLVFSSFVFHCVATKIAAEVRRHGGNAYVYRFTRVRPGGEKLQAYHGAEIPYAFDTADDWLPGDEVDEALSNTMLSYWTNFVKNGDPNGEDLPHWPLYDETLRSYQELGDTVVSGKHLDARQCELINSIWNENLALTE